MSVASAEKVSHLFESAQDAQRYILAGAAKFTVVSKATGTRFTFQVNTKENRNGFVRFVSVLNGPDNWRNYAYIGCLQEDRVTIRFTSGSKVGQDAPSARAILWLLAALEAGMLPANVEVWHEGSCGRCGRTLTVPESIASGIGPECAKKV